MGRGFVKQSGFVAEHARNQSKKIIDLQAENKRLREELEPYRAKPGGITHLEWLGGRVKDLQDELQALKETQ